MIKVTYDMVPLVAFLALIAAAIGMYMFYAGKSVRIVQYRRWTAAEFDQVLIIPTYCPIFQYK